MAKQLRRLARARLEALEANMYELRKPGTVSSSPPAAALKVQFSSTLSHGDGATGCAEVKDASNGLII